MHSGKRRNLKYIQVHDYATVTGEDNKTMVIIIWYLKKSNIKLCKYSKCGTLRNR